MKKQTQRSHRIDRRMITIAIALRPPHQGPRSDENP